ncbi:hypothetical protein L1887_15610 [Cichorium endivia]|nr:hypothetical protein L1887_15610 [Cichorium endivia]
MAGEIEEPFRFDFQADILHSGSISFGRFESESLSWERRSSFSHNRYLEEVEKYSKPGSVTEKKAYFEAHFRRKALLKQSSSESQDVIQSPTSQHDDLQDLQESQNLNCFDEIPQSSTHSKHDEKTKIEKSVNKNTKTLSEKETLDDMATMVTPTSEMKQPKTKLKNSVKDKTKESKSLQIKEKEKKTPHSAIPIVNSVRKNIKSEESSMSFRKAKIVPLNKSMVKEYKSEKIIGTKSLVLEKSLSGARQTASRTKQTTITPSVNQGSRGFTFRSDQRAERRKEEKRVAAEVAESRKSHNFKATPMPSFYKKEKFIRPSSSPSLTKGNPPRKTYVPIKNNENVSTKGPRTLRKDVKGVDLVNGKRPGYLAVSIAS